ncbi:MAG: SDR family NAD(P)-dependent oxidoreductase [Dehalococcoidales bacterium]|nr:SDR family NAD(P)-dependent oxidoreductase [Dehalococcoidales bacterium]
MGFLDGRVALVTGASGGIGKAICGRLAGEGADVVCHYNKDMAGVDAAAAAVRESGRQALVVQANLAVAAEARKIVHQAVERFGRLDVLINNAGTYPRSWALELTEEEWDLVLDTNLKGTFMCSQAAAPIMKRASWGRIVNMSSIARKGQARGAHYSASKAGIVGLTRALAIEWAPEILVNAIAPGLIDTPQPRQGLTEEQIAERARALLIPRIGTPDDIARVVLFLLSDGGSWMTGQVLSVNGGDPRD